MRRLSSLLLALCAGCGLTLAGISGRGVDRAAVRPEEPDAILLCGGRRCEAAPLERQYDHRLNKAGYAAGTTVDAGLLALGIGLSKSEGNTLSGVILGLSALFVALDIYTPLRNGFDGTAEPWKLAQPVVTDFRGRRVELEARDLLQNGNPLPTFSAAALPERPRRTPP